MGELCRKPRARNDHRFELEEAGKDNALNAGDTIAAGDIRIYLDADVLCGTGMIRALVDTLKRDDTLFTSGRIQPTTNGDLAAHLYATVWKKLPFIRYDVPGPGLYAVNKKGRNRWDAFPEIHSDDKYVRLLFSPAERRLAPVDYDWPVPEGLRNLIRVRSRWCRGNSELAQAYPELQANDSSRKTSISEAIAIAVRNPLASLCFGFIYTAAKFRAMFYFDSEQVRWERGRL